MSSAFAVSFNTDLTINTTLLGIVMANYLLHVTVTSDARRTRQQRYSSCCNQYEYSALDCAAGGDCIGFGGGECSSLDRCCCAPNLKRRKNRKSDARMLSASENLRTTKPNQTKTNQTKPNQTKTKNDDGNDSFSPVRD